MPIKICPTPSIKRKTTTMHITTFTTLLRRHSSISVVALITLMTLIHACAPSARKRQHDEQQAYRCLEQAVEHNAQQQYDSAQKAITRGLSFAHAADSTRGMLYAEWSTLCLQQGDMPRARNLGREAIRLCQHNIQPAMFAIVCGNVGIVYRRLGQNDSAAICYNRGIREAMQADSTDADAQDAVAYLSNNLSVLYCEMGRYAESLNLAQRAQDAARRAGDDIEIHSAIINRAITLHKMGHNRQAWPLLTKEWQKAAAEGNVQLKLKMINYLLAVARDMDNQAAVRQYLAEAQPLLPLIPPQSIQAQGIREAQMNLLANEGRYAEAMAIAQNMDTLSTQIQVIPPHTMHRFMAKCLAGMGRYREALLEEQRAASIEDSVAGEQTRRQLSEFTIKLKTHEKELSIARLKQRNTQYALTGVVVTGVLLTVIIILMARRQQMRRKMAAERSQRYIEGLEDERVRLAHELHDGISNDLLALSMRMTCMQNSEQDTIEQINTLRNEVRRISHEMMPPKFDLVSLDDILADYARSMADLISIDYRCERQSDVQPAPHQSYQLYRITQEAVSNIIGHTANRKAQITLTYKASGLSLRITNQTGTPSSTTHGRGLEAMRLRAESIGAKLSIEQNRTAFTIQTDLAL